MDNLLAIPLPDASHLTYLLLCPRKLWLHHHGMRLEDNSADVHAGKHLGEKAYARRASRWRELRVGPVIIDHYDPRERLIREVKKSPQLEHAHLAQVRYYQWHLERAGVPDARGRIEYPKQRRATEVPVLAKADRTQLHAWLAEITAVCAMGTAPAAVKKPYCRKCAFYDFCYV